MNKKWGPYNKPRVEDTSKPDKQPGGIGLAPAASASLRVWPDSGPDVCARGPRSNNNKDDSLDLGSQAPLLLRFRFWGLQV